MTKNTLTAIVAALSTVEFENKTEIMAEIEKELNRGSAEKAERAAAYKAAWPVVEEAMKAIDSAATVADIFNECEKNLPEGFTKSRISYGMTHYWTDRVVKTEGKVNTYTLKE